LTGFPVGSVPPFGHPTPLLTVCDTGVPSDGELSFGSGHEDALLVLTLSELERVLSLEHGAIAIPQP
jgi:prolyl-tRNA editing enzyme YbaK/EbsC (Cys-tRNA(Pro) deacylase)